MTQPVSKRRATASGDWLDSSAQHALEKTGIWSKGRESGGAASGSAERYLPPRRRGLESPIGLSVITALLAGSVGGIMSVAARP
jgi:hypothetical protein